ncbi:MAG: MnhB domain-containing protein [Sphingorhabdus sp.]
MTGPFTIALDGVLIAIAIGLTIGTLWTRDQARSLMLFIAFGGVVALIWMRLRAPDVALAEAAIGAALTGGLMLRIRPMLPPVTNRQPVSLIVRAVAAASSVILFLALAFVLLTLDWAGRPSLAGPVAANLAESGVTNPVTAVLLNFRAYDTLLEVAVLLVAVVGVWMLAPRAPALSPLKGDRLYFAMLRPLVPLLCLLSGYLLWLGAFAPGGAFQAGAVLSAAFLFLLMSGVAKAPGRSDTMGLRFMLGGGLLLFILVGIATMVLGGAFLEYPPLQAKNLILAIEAALTFSITFTLMMLFMGGRPFPADDRRP